MSMGVGRGRKSGGREPEVRDRAIKIPYASTWISATLLDQTTWIARMLPFWKGLAPSYSHSLRCLSQALSSGNFLWWWQSLSWFNSMVAFTTLHHSLFICSPSHSEFLFSFTSRFIFQCYIYWVFFIITSARSINKELRVQRSNTP